MLGYGQPGGAPPPPPGYGAPPPPPPPGYGGGFESKTEKGVKYFKYSMLLYIIIALLGFVLALIALSAIPAITSTDSAEDAVSAAIGLLAAIVIVACVVVLLGLLVLVFFIMGIINFNSGKNEFPGAHTSSVNTGMIFFILAIVMFFVNVGVGMALGPSSGTNVQEMWESIRTSAIVSSIVGLLSSIFMGLMFVFMIKQLAAESDKKLLNAGLMLLIIGGILSIVITFIMLPADIGDVTSSDLTNISSSATQVSNLGGIASFIGYILFFVAYNHTHKAMIAGQVRPSGGAPPPGGRPPPAPGGYPPPPPPPQGRYPPPPPPPRGY